MDSKALLFFVLALCACQNPFETSPSSPQDSFELEGNPSPGSTEIYSTANMKELCLSASCKPPYDSVPEEWINTTDSRSSVCNFDYNPNKTTAFSLVYPSAPINGLKLLLSKEDLFFIAWVSIRQRINPHFMLAVMAQESAGNCSAVSSSHGEGCFQITNTFGQGQLTESYPERTQSWHWSDRNRTYYPDDIFVDELSYFGQQPDSEQFRITLNPQASAINGVDVSSVVNFPFGIIGSSLYFHWQQLLLYRHYPELEEEALDLFEQPDGKALWQAAAYNGGAYGAAQALGEGGRDFLNSMHAQTQDYAERILDYCHEFQANDTHYNPTLTQDDVEWMIDLLSMTYPENDEIDWDGVQEEVAQIFFSDGNRTLHYADDIKALVYVISTHTPLLGPEWPR